ncbi:MAG: cytochrome-c oxidase, cbb3-type subunit II [Gammaproteobacteria bacterium]|nr:MAG: cytochrome-c oxidase, cbb3-type subunit II [Gammaproteobacteria bacterium]
MNHEKVEKSINIMAILIVIVISIGGLVEIIPLMTSSAVTDPLPGIKPYPALQLAGRDIYIREGCYGCHSQQIRPFRSETERYGPYSVAGEFVYDRPFQFGSKRTGPDLARIGKRYSDEWHRIHLSNPRDLVPESNMPAYSWLVTTPVDGELVARKMRALQILGDPYTDEQIAQAAAAVAGKTELDAMVDYLQNLGTVRAAR